MEWVILMYHSVLPRKVSKEYLIDLGLAVDLKDFENQVMEFKKKYTVMDIKTVIKMIKNKKKLPSKILSFTFDDGLKEQYKFAIPILKKHKLPATFFVNYDLIFGKPRYLDVFYELVEQAKNKKIYPKNANFNIKEKLKSMNRKKRDELLFKFAKKFDLDIDLAINNLKDSYINLQELEDINNSGFEIGFHTYSHSKLAAVKPTIAKNEIIIKEKDLHNFNGINFLGFSYPFGGKDAVDDTTINIVANNYEYGCISDPGINDSENIDFYTLKRIDSKFLQKVGNAWHFHIN